MDSSERAVLNRRREFLACLDFNEELQNSIVRKGLLTISNVRDVWRKKDNQQKSKELVGFLESKGTHVSFSQFCSMMGHLGQNFLEEFLRADLAMERGDLIVEECFLATAAGKARTMPELKNDALIRAVALRISEECQVVKEACSKQMEVVQAKKGNTEVDENELLNWILRCLLDLRSDMTELRPISAVHKSVSQVTEYSGRKKKGSKNKEMSCQESIEEAISGMQEDVDKIRESITDLLDERRCCFDLMREEDDGGKLDEFLRRYIDGMIAEIKKARGSQVRNSKGGARGRVEDLEMQCRDQEEAISNLQKSLLENQQECQIIIVEMEYWKCRCKKVENCRRIGYHSKEINENGKKGKVTVSKEKFLSDPDGNDPELKQMRERMESAKSAGRTRSNAGPDDKVTCTNTCPLHCKRCMGLCTKHCH